jgi:8-oxo-dGTP pyrophosphatase MutT (NUDIX family)/phosphohistidine phosphatase SixA
VSGPPVVRASGAVCWRRSDGDRLEVLLVHSARYGEWTWPKGKPEPAEGGAPESLPECAVREVAEESGVTVRLGRPLPEVRYRLPDGRRKRVSYWVGRPVHEGKRTAQDDEIDDVAWVTPDEAYERLSRRSDHKPLNRLMHLAVRDRLGTRALVVVRHAESVPRKKWEGSEADRPLDDEGRRQAQLLVPLLGAWRPERLLTSPWQRCRDTLLPYAVDDHDALLNVPELTEDAALQDPGAAAAVVRRLIASDEDVAMCTHRPVLASVVSAMGEATTLKAQSDLPRRDPWLAKAEVLVAHVTPGPTGSRIRAVERYRTA